MKAINLLLAQVVARVACRPHAMEEGQVEIALTGLSHKAERSYERN